MYFDALGYNSVHFKAFPRCILVDCPVFRCIRLYFCALDYISKHSAVQPDAGVFECKSVNLITFHCILIHFCALHYISLHLRAVQWREMQPGVLGCSAAPLVSGGGRLMILAGEGEGWGEGLEGGGVVVWHNRFPLQVLPRKFCSGTRFCAHLAYTPGCGISHRFCSHLLEEKGLWYGTTLADWNIWTEMKVFLKLRQRC